MTKSTFLILLSTMLIHCNSFGQMTGGGMQVPDFDAEKAAGIISYNPDKVVKKLKLSDESKKNTVARFIKDYNTKIDALSIENAATFKYLEDEFDKNIKIAMQNRDRSQMDGIKAKITTTIPPIRKQVLEYEKVLNDSLAEILTEKQNEKWLKYQKQKK